MKEVSFYKVSYLNQQTDYYDTFEELKRFYGHEECEDLFELEEALREEAQGEPCPNIEVFYYED